MDDRFQEQCAYYWLSYTAFTKPFSRLPDESVVCLLCRCLGPFGEVPIEILDKNLEKNGFLVFDREDVGDLVIELVE
jgi:hypothetical protein